MEIARIDYDNLHNRIKELEKELSQACADVVELGTKNNALKESDKKLMDNTINEMAYSYKIKVECDKLEQIVKQIKGLNFDGMLKTEHHKLKKILEEIKT